MRKLITLFGVSALALAPLTIGCDNKNEDRGGNVPNSTNRGTDTRDTTAGDRAGNAGGDRSGSTAGSGATGGGTGAAGGGNTTGGGR